MIHLNLILTVVTCGRYIISTYLIWFTTQHTFHVGHRNWTGLRSRSIPGLQVAGSHGKSPGNLLRLGTEFVPGILKRKGDHCDDWKSFLTHQGWACWVFMGFLFRGLKAVTIYDSRKQFRSTAERWHISTAKSVFLFLILRSTRSSIAAMAPSPWRPLCLDAYESWDPQNESMIVYVYVLEAAIFGFHNVEIQRWNI